MEKTYNPREFEDKLYKEWEEGGCFKAVRDDNKVPFTVMMPPPNITGQLHMGHAMDETLQDTVIRFKRMQGYCALWLPGTDHASIATEVKVLEQVKAEGESKESLGREKFLERVWQWKDKYCARIVEQLKKLGSSCDWSRLTFTMDEKCSKAVREVFVNLCVHPDYKAEGSLTVIFKNGTYFFSNPGTMLVSQEQFFEGGESVCRNPTIQKMFMMLGPAEKAGSGGAKIIEGWRRNNWKTPFIFERTRPDKVELSLSMQSLIQPEVLDELNNRLGIETQKFSPQVQTVLALALTEENVTNERLRYVLRLHKSDITTLLQNMCRQGLLFSDGYGRGTKYRLANIVSSNNLISNSDNVDSLGSNVDSLGSNVDSSNDNSNTTTEVYIISAEAQCLLRKKRLRPAEMEELIYEITSEWRTIQELTQILGKDKSYLRNHVLPILISKGVLEREYTSIPNHPNQRYRRTPK